jgi:3-methyladenine DNA glycosylase AlkD
VRLRFFKEEVNLYGVMSAVVSRISKTSVSARCRASKSEIFNICDALVGFRLYGRIVHRLQLGPISSQKKYEPADFEIFQRWVMNNVSNWASCDALQPYSWAPLSTMYPELLARLKQWAKEEKPDGPSELGSLSDLYLPRKGRYLNDYF